MKHEQLSYYDALRFLAKKYNIEIQERELSEREKQVRSDRESMLIVNSWAQKYFTTQLYEHQEGKAAGLRYFAERGFREDTIRKFQLGYSLDQRDALYKAATKSGYKKEFLEKTGLVIAYDNGGVNDRFRGRVIFPVHTLSGKVVAFGGRVLKKDEKTAKYVNSPESEIYHKSNELYGIYFAKQAIVKADRCFLVEGYTDVISMHQAGVENVVASSGTALTQGQIRLIHRFTSNITVLYDGDAAGIKAALRGIDLLLEDGMNVKVVLLPDGEDPDSFARKHNASQFAEFIRQNETDFIRFKNAPAIGRCRNGSDQTVGANLRHYPDGGHHPRQYRPLPLYPGMQYDDGNRRDAPVERSEQNPPQQGRKASEHSVLPHSGYSHQYPRIPGYSRLPALPGRDAGGTTAGKSPAS